MIPGRLPRVPISEFYHTDNKEEAIELICPYCHHPLLPTKIGHITSRHCGVVVLCNCTNCGEAMSLTTTAFNFAAPPATGTLLSMQYSDYVFDVLVEAKHVPRYKEVKPIVEPVRRIRRDIHHVETQTPEVDQTPPDARKEKVRDRSPDRRTNRARRRQHP